LLVRPASFGIPAFARKCMDCRVRRATNAMLEMPRRDRQSQQASASALVDDQNLPDPPFNFHDARRFKCGSSDADWYKIFMTCLDGSPMPSWSDNIRPDGRPCPERMRIVQFTCQASNYIAVNMLIPYQPRRGTNAEHEATTGVMKANLK
jgi:hypothetical protein